MQADPYQGPPLCPCTYFDINYGSVKSPNNLVFFDKDIAINEVARMRQDEKVIREAAALLDELAPI